MTRNTPKILIVEDDADIRDLMKIFLEADGYRVDAAADGIDALEQLHAGARPTVILLDLMMPRMDGEQFLKQLRASEFAKIPVVIISGHWIAPRRARELCADCCLMKPVEFTELLKTVRRFTTARSNRDAA
jgi:CheY-like chemotaxis protein